MNKKFLSAMLFGVITIVATSMFVSCKDYDDDIYGLQEQITANANNIAAIQDLLKTGVVITKVEEDGRDVVLTLSNGTTQRIKGGVDGAKGDKGDKGDTGAQGPQGEQGPAGKDAAVWSISEDGYWQYTQDGVTTKTTSPARGEKGEKGETGATGAQGPKGDTGATGAQGPKGDTGATGAQGPKGDTGAAGKDGGYYYPGEDGYWYYVGINADGTKAEPVKQEAAGTASSWVGQGITVAQEDDKVIFKNLPGQDADASITIDTKLALKSLVLYTDLVYHGVPAIEASTYKYAAWKKDAVDADKDYTKAANLPIANISAVMTGTPATQVQVTYVPGIIGTYHINPSAAKIDNDYTKYAYAIHNAVYTKAVADVPTIKEEGVSIDETNGLVTVRSNPFTNNGYIKDINADEQVTMLALQYNDGDNGTVTSDYAALKSYNYNNFVLIHQKIATLAGDVTYNLDKLFENAAGLTPAGTVDIQYNKDINLNDYVKAQVFDGKNGVNKVLTSAELEALGFYMEYDLVGWINPSVDETSQSAHAAINPEDGVTLHPQRVDAAGKQQPYGAATGHNIEGREPIVRAVLRDKNNEDYIIAYGFIRLVIVPEVITPETPSYPCVTPSAWNRSDAYTPSCDGTAKYINEPLLWNDVETQVLGHADVDLSKNDFENNYELDEYDATNHYANQFENTTDNNGEPVALAAGKRFGTVKLEVNPGDMATNRLWWTVTNAEAYDLFVKTTPAVTSITRYVRFKRKAGSGKKYIYFELKSTPSTINGDVTLQINDEAKNASYWYQAGSYQATGKDQILANVENVTNAMTRNFTFDVVGTFDGTKDQFTGNTAWNNIKSDPATAVSYKFVAPSTPWTVDGNTLTVNATGTQILCGAEIIATITNDANGTVVYNNGFIAQKLLNRAPYSDPNNSFTATVQVEVTVCGFIDASKVKIQNPTFPVKFQRPITVTSGTGATFADDVVNDGMGGNKQEVGLQFVDWANNREFVAKSAEYGINFFDYYNITAITYNVANATTTMNGHAWSDNAKLADVTNNKIQLIPANPTTAEIKGVLGAGTWTTKPSFGTITYKNNGASVAEDFEVRVPTTITYYWGSFDTYVTLKVNKTH